jgi:hypothetical protein
MLFPPVLINFDTQVKNLKEGEFRLRDVHDDFSTPIVFLIQNHLLKHKLKHDVSIKKENI